MDTTYSNIWRDLHQTIGNLIQHESPIDSITHQGQTVLELSLPFPDLLKYFILRGGTEYLTESSRTRLSNYALHESAHRDRRDTKVWREIVSLVNEGPFPGNRRKPKRRGLLEAIKSFTSRTASSSNNQITRKPCKEVWGEKPEDRLIN